LLRLLHVCRLNCTHSKYLDNALTKSVLSALVISSLLISCSQPNEQILDAQPPVPAGGEFSAKVKPILDRNCGGSSCHSGGSSGFAGGVDLTSYEGIFRGGIYGTVVAPGSAFMSSLVQSINRSDTTLSPISSVGMPAGRNPISPAEVQVISQWINNGALNDDGREPFPEPRPMGKVYFSSQSVDLVGVLDIETSRIIRYVSVGNALPLASPPQAPHNVQIDDQGRYFYTTMISTGMLKKYDVGSYQLVGEVSVGSSPAHVVITQDGSKAYVTNFSNSLGQVTVVNTQTMTVTGTITAPPLMNKTHGARLSHDGRYLYVASNLGDLVHVIRTSDDQAIAHIPLAPGVPPIGSSKYKPYQIAVRDDDRFIYVTLTDSAMVSVIERLDSTFSFFRLLPVGARPLQCEITRDQRFLYVCNQGSRSVTVIDAQANSVLTTILNVGPRPHGIDITEDSRLVYVSCENSGGTDPPHHPVVGSTAPGYLTIIDVNTQSVIRTIEVGGFAAGVSISPGKGN